MLNRVRLRPGDSASGWVYFEIGLDTIPASFRYELEDFGYYGEWQLQ